LHGEGEPERRAIPAASEISALGRDRDRRIVIQQATRRPIRFDITEETSDLPSPLL
jgi:hypothetical protein